MNFSLQQLRHFLAVVDAGSLGKAARLVHVSQPALTKSIHRLEQEVGLRLFDRDRGMILSTVGRQFLPKARRLMEQSADLGREVTLLNRATSGHVVVGCGPLLVETLIAPAVAELINQRPGVNVDVVTAEWHEFPQQLQAGRLDFFVANLSMFDDHADFERTAFHPQPVLWFGRAGHPLTRRRGVVPAAAFFQYAFAGPVIPAWMDAWLQRHVSQPVEPPFRFRIVCSHYPALKEIVRRSDCVSGATAPVLARDIADGALVPLPLDLPPLMVQAGLVRLRHRILSPAAHALYEAVERHADSLGAPAAGAVVRRPRSASQKSVA